VQASERRTSFVTVITL